MATEIISVPEEDLADVVSVIRAGLGEVVIEAHVSEMLEEWCRDMEEYLLEISEED